MDVIGAKPIKFEEPGKSKGFGVLIVEIVTVKQLSKTLYQSSKSGVYIIKKCAGFKYF